MATVADCLALLGDKADLIDDQEIASLITGFQQSGRSSKAAHLMAVDALLAEIDTDIGHVRSQSEVFLAKRQARGPGLDTVVQQAAESQPASDQATSASAVDPRVEREQRMRGLFSRARRQIRLAATRQGRQSAEPQLAQDGTVAEPLSDLEGAIAAVADGRKPAAYDATGKAKAPKGLVKVLIPKDQGGGAYYIPAGKGLKARREALRAKHAAGDQAGILGYEQNKDEVRDQENSPVVSAVDAQGRHVSDQLVDPDVVNAAIDAAREQAGEGGTVEVGSAQSVLERRAPSQETTDGGQGQEEGRGRQESLLNRGPGDRQTIAGRAPVRQGAWHTRAPVWETEEDRLGDLEPGQGDIAAWREHGEALKRVLGAYAGQPTSVLMQHFSDSAKAALKAVFPRAKNFAERIALLKMLYDAQLEQDEQGLDAAVYDQQTATEREAMEPITIRLTKARGKKGEAPLSTTEVNGVVAALRQLIPGVTLTRVGQDWDITVELTNGELQLFRQTDSTAQSIAPSAGLDVRNVEKALTALINSLATGFNKQAQRLELKARAKSTEDNYTKGRFNMQGLVDFGFQLLGYYKPIEQAQRKYVSDAFVAALGFLSNAYEIPMRKVVITPRPKGSELAGPQPVTRIISGGQTGADVGGLIAGKLLGLETGGTAPRGFRTEAGNNPELGAKYGLTEHASSGYVERTKANVDSSDGTVAFRLKDSAGTDRTIGYAQTGKWTSPNWRNLGRGGRKPVLVLTDLNDAAGNAARIRSFVQQHGIKTLNIAGHRESSSPGLAQKVAETLTAALQPETAAAQPTGKPKTTYELALDPDELVYKTKDGKLTWQDLRPESRGSSLLNIYEAIDEKAPGLRKQIATLQGERGELLDKVDELENREAGSAVEAKQIAASKKGHLIRLAAIKQELKGLYERRDQVRKEIAREWNARGKMTWTGNEVENDQQLWERDDVGDPTTWGATSRGVERTGPEEVAFGVAEDQARAVAEMREQLTENLRTIDDEIARVKKASVQGTENRGRLINQLVNRAANVVENLRQMLVPARQTMQEARQRLEALQRQRGATETNAVALLRNTGDPQGITTLQGQLDAQIRGTERDVRSAQVELTKLEGQLAKAEAKLEALSARQRAYAKLRTLRGRDNRNGKTSAAVLESLQQFRQELLDKLAALQTSSWRHTPAPPWESQGQSGEYRPQVERAIAEQKERAKTANQRVSDSVPAFDRGLEEVGRTKEEEQAIEAAGGETAVQTDRENRGDYTVQNTEADLNLASRLEPSPKARSPRDAEIIAKTRETLQKLTSGDQVQAFGGAAITNMANAVKAVLGKLGIQTRVILIDDLGIGELLQSLDELANTAGEAGKGYQQMAASLRASYAKNKNGFIIANNTNPEIYLRTPVIYVSNNPSKALVKPKEGVKHPLRKWHMGETRSQITVLAHELGHLVDYTLLEQARKMAARSGDPNLTGDARRQVEEAQALMDALGEVHQSLGKNAQVMSEWLANQFVAFISKHRVLGKEFEDAGKAYEAGVANLSEKTTLALERFWKVLALKLHDMWAQLKAVFGLSEPFEQFILGVMDAARMRETGNLGRHGEYGRRFARVTNALTSSPFMDAQAAVAPGQAFTVPVARRAETLLNWARGTHVYKVTRSWTRWMHETVTQSTDAYLRDLGLDWLADEFHHRPDVRGTRLKETIDSELRRRVAEWHRRSNALLQRFSEKKWYDAVLGIKLGHINHDSAAYREAMTALIGHRNPQGAEARQIVAEVRQYFADLRRYLLEMGLDIPNRRDFFPIAYKVGEVDTRMVEFLEVLEDEFGFSQQEASDMAKAVTHTNGVELTPGIGFGHLQRRALGPRELARLHELGFIEDDLGTVITAYTHSGIHRAISDQRFGKTVEMDDGTTYREPMGGLYERLNQHLADGLLTPEEHERVVGVMLPALFGQLGANMSPNWKRLQAGAITLQNFRLLAGATLSSIPDLAGIFVRGDWASTKVAIKAMFSKQTREQLMDMAELLGVIRDDYTAHALNDTSQDQYLGSKFRVWNENFFRAIQLHRWTNFNRIAALSAGLRFLKTSAVQARAGDATAQQALRELGVTAEEVRAWEADGATAPAAWGQEGFGAHSNVHAALSQFVDEAIMRPSASVRPGWGNDQRMAVFFHLKSFVWNFQEVMLRRLWSQIKNEPNYRKLLPVISFAIPYLALAAVGYELRRWIFNGGEPIANKEGADYWFEVLQRSGGLGVMQLMVDMEEASDRGRLSLLAVAGPTVSHLEELWTKDFIDSLPRSLPGFAQSPILRAWLQNSLDDVGLVELKPGKYAWNEHAMGR